MKSVILLFIHKKIHSDDVCGYKKCICLCRCPIESGVGGIRTHASLATPNGFRVRPLQPDLGTTPGLKKCKKKKVEEVVGFEPTQAITPLTVFKTVPLNHLGTPPKDIKLCEPPKKKWRRWWDSNPRRLLHP